MHESATDVAFDNRELIRIGANSVNSRVDFGAKLVTETGTLSVVIGCRSVEFGCGER